jgi:hypothetical protein
MPEITGPVSIGGSGIAGAAIAGTERVGREEFPPLAIEQKSARGRATLPLLLLAPAVATMLAPLGLIAVSVVPTLEIIADNPLAALQASAGIALWTGLFVVPVRRLLRHWRCARSVRIADGVVTVREQAVLGYRTWQLPLQEFAGIAHLVRSSLSGVRQELYLVHPKRSKSLLIHCAESIPPAAVARVGEQLGLPVVPALRLYPRLATAPAPARGDPHAA